MTLARIRPVSWYVAAVSAAGGAALILGLADQLDAIPWNLSAFLILALMILLGELWDIRLPRRDDVEYIVTSTTFAFAMLLLFGTAPTIWAKAIASLIADVRQRKPLWKIFFNVAQITLAIAATGWVLDVLSFPHAGTALEFDVVHLPAVAAGALMYFAANNFLTGVAIALSQDVPIKAFLMRDLRFQALTSALQLGFSPIVVVVVSKSPVVGPLLVVPILAVHRFATALVDKDHQALHDGLTGLPNRTDFRDRVQELLAERGDLGSVAVMLIDLDRFKEINDTLGHHTGDRLLQQIGPRLSECLRGRDTIARLGGDEFAVVLPGVTDERVAVEIANRLISALDEPFDLSEMALHVEASIGIAMAPAHGDDVDTLLQRADVAMYLAKEERSAVEVYREDRDRYSPQRLVLSNQLRPALESSEFELFYQPKADLRDGTVTGVEALVRWRHPERGMIPPDLFIPLAEHIGLIGPLTLWVLEEALQQCRAWRVEGLDLSVAVNISVRNLHDPRFPADVESLLQTHGAHPSWLVLEITESTIMADPGRVIGVLHTLQDIGLELSLDDFGTGYSSLAYLKRLPVSELKIDKSFITAMTNDESDKVIVEATLDLARNLRLRTVAEGVETSEVWDELARLGCDVAQGYLLSRPKPASEITPWLHERRAAQRIAATEPGVRLVTP